MSTDNSTSSNPYAPVGESSWDILNDSVNLIGSTTMCGVAYGFALALVAVCTSLYYKQLKKNRSAIYQMIFISVMLMFATVYVASNSRTMQLAYVNNRNFPGGPAQYDLFIFFEPITIAGLVSFFIISWMCDALLLWRLSVVFRASPYLVPALAIPVLLYLASLSMSIVTIVESTRPNSSFWSTTAIKFSLSYYSLSTAFTIVATGLMMVRLLLFRKRFQGVLGNNHGRQYTNIAAMLVESSALYTVWSVIFLGLYIVNHPVQYVFLASLPGVQVISPVLIILRVCQGNAWSTTTERDLSTFQAQSLPRLRSGNSSSGTRSGNNGNEGTSITLYPLKSSLKSEGTYDLDEV